MSLKKIIQVRFNVIYFTSNCTQIKKSYHFYNKLILIKQLPGIHKYRCRF